MEKTERITILMPEAMTNELRHISGEKDKGKISVTIRRACKILINSHNARKTKKGEEKNG